MALDAQQRTEILDEWDHAYRRVESYLQACGVSPRILLTELAVKIIETARTRAASDRNGATPVEIAMRVLFTEMSQTFGDSAERPRDELCRARVRLALATGGAAPAWAQSFLAPAAATEKRGTFIEQPLQTGPELRLSKLPPAQIEYAFGDTDDDTTYVGRRVPVAALALAVSVVGAMGAAWAATH